MYASKRFARSRTILPLMLACVAAGGFSGCTRTGDVSAVNTATASVDNAKPWVEVVSVGRADRPVDVVVGETSRPVILVLTAKTRVNWNLIRTFDARVARVLTSGAPGCHVAYAHGLDVTYIGDAYAASITGDLAALDAAVRKSTGLPMHAIQGDDVALRDYHIGFSNISYRGPVGDVPQQQLAAANGSATR